MGLNPSWAAGVCYPVVCVCFRVWVQTLQPAVPPSKEFQQTSVNETWQTGGKRRTLDCKIHRMELKHMRPATCLVLFFFVPHEMRKLEAGEAVEEWQWRAFGTCSVIASRGNRDKNPANCWLTVRRTPRKSTGWSSFFLFSKTLTCWGQRPL
jgi:hypothetical protein